MLFLACSSSTLFEEYVQISQSFLSYSIPFKLFVTSRVYEKFQEVEIFPALQPHLVTIPQYLIPWLKDLCPQFYLPVNNPDLKGVAFSFRYQPFYRGYVGSFIDSFVSRFGRDYLVPHKVLLCQVDGVLDGGAVLSICKDNKILVFCGEGWRADFSPIITIASSFSISIQVYKVPSDPLFHHIDGLYSIFPSLTESDTYCFIFVPSMLPRPSYGDVIMEIVSNELSVRIDPFQFPHQPKPEDARVYDYRIPACCVNGLALPDQAIYAFLTYGSVSEHRRFLAEIGFFDFLIRHGYQPVSIWGDGLLQWGGGLSCAVYNAFYL